MAQELERLQQRLHMVEQECSKWATRAGRLQGTLQLLVYHTHNPSVTMAEVRSLALTGLNEQQEF